MKKYLKRIFSVFICAILLMSNLMGTVSLAADNVYELAFDNLFVFEQWANNVNSGIAQPGSPGTLTKDISAGSLTLTHTGASTAETYTAHSMSSMSGYYNMDIKPNTSYTMAFDVVGTVTNFESFIFFYDSNGNYFTHINRSANNYNLNEWVFTSPENAEYIQIRFDVNSPGTYAIVSQIRICETSVYEYSKNLPMRRAFTYSAGTTYGELPEPSRESLFFGGWYTGPDGTGEKITADTKMSARSYSLYSKWEQIAISDMSLVSPPVKQEYCVGERINTRGLVISVTYPDGTKENLDEGFTCSPEILTATGTQTVTVKYGTGTAQFTVNVKASENETVKINGTQKTVGVANDTYTLNYSGTAFNRFELTYSSDAYVKAEMNMNGVIEEFFLEPDSNGTFAGYIDGFLTGTTRTTITSISFKPLNKEFMNFSLSSVTLTKNSNPGDSEGMVYLSDANYKIGVDLDWGGALTYLEDLKNDVVEAQKQKLIGTSSELVQVGLSSDFKSSSSIFGTKYTTKGNVNLINAHDTGRLVQQSYYGKGDTSYVPGNFQGTAWPYNPVQGGNLLNEASKIVDIKVSTNEIYIKCRPLDWAREAKYITPSYMEAWYTLEDGMMRATCRFVDFSGYPSLTTTQELPAFYCVEPLNHMVYYSGGDAWSDSNQKTTVTDLQFWGEAPYAEKQQYTCNENWAAFVGNTTSGYGIGVYAPGQTHMNAGVLYRDTIKSLDTPTALCDPTSYIGVFGMLTFQSYKPISYCYYLKTGDTDTIRSSFKSVAQTESDICNGTHTAGFCDMCGKQVEPELTTSEYDVDGNGTMDSVYEIGTVGELMWFRDYVNSGNTTANAVLTADIVINKSLLNDNGKLIDTSASTTWTPIGNNNAVYNGKFHGQGHTISGLYSNSSSTSYLGLFGKTGANAVIREVGITDSYISANAFAGVICGDNAGTITNCYVTRSVLTATQYAGGIAGSSNGRITNCYSTASVKGTSYVGGICGYYSAAAGSEISNCYYLQDSAVNNSGVSQNGIGNIADNDTDAIRKSLSEFYSGEVAYRLQKFNSTQVWGQYSNAENSAPIFDYEGTYKVSVAQNTDCYAVCFTGDFKSDGIIDVEDYQQQVNMAVMRDYDITDLKSMLRADLNADGVVDALDCSALALICGGLKNGISVHPVGDFDFDGTAFTQDDITAIKRGLINQGTLTLRQKYACDLNGDGILDVNDRDILMIKEEHPLMPIFVNP